MRNLIVVLAAAIGPLVPPVCFAQGTDHRWFVGGGVGSARTDLVNRGLASSFDSPRPFRVWFLEASVIRARRAAFGLEYVDLGEVGRRSETSCCFSRGRQHEGALLGVVRTRAAGTGRVSADVIGGLGALVQRRELTIGFRFPSSQSTETETTRSPAVVFGVDVPVWLAPRLTVAPLMHLYFLQRETIRQGSTVFQQPSRRLAVGVTGRATW